MSSILCVCACMCAYMYVCICMCVCVGGGGGGEGLYWYSVALSPGSSDYYCMTGSAIYGEIFSSRVAVLA